MLSLVRTQSGGIRRYFSPYLASAFLMLVGAYQLLYHGESNPYREVLYLFLTQLSYQILLVVLAFYLLRKAKMIEDAYLLLGAVAIFLMDVLFIQHLYGWADQLGMRWAILNSITGLILLFSASAALGLNPFNRMTFTLACLLCFIRLGPRLLLNNEIIFNVAFSYVALSWLFAACLLPLIFLREPVSKFDSISPDVIEKVILPFAFGLGLFHFMTAGDSFHLEFEIVYLAPFTVVFPLALEKLSYSDSITMKRSYTYLSSLGLFFAASKQALPIYDIFGLGEGPLTPFWFTLIACAAVFWHRSFSNKRPELLHLSALALCMSFLGGNLSEVLVNIFYPQVWHVVFVPVICFATSFYTRSIRSSVWLNLLPTLVVNSWLVERHFPFLAGFFVVSALSVLILELSCRINLLPRVRMMLLTFILGLPLAFLFIQDTSFTKFLFGSISIGLLGWGYFSKQRFYLWSSIVAIAIAILGFPLALQMHEEGSIGKMCIQLSFVLLLLGFSNSIFGRRIQELMKRTFQPVEPSTP
jgi:hypothetical protein